MLQPNAAYLTSLSAITEHADVPVLRRAVSAMTDVYKTESGQGKRLVADPNMVLAYAVTRMPATLGAVSAALSHTLHTLPDGEAAQIHTVLDLGAGCGTGVFAACSVLPQAMEITCVEREKTMADVGRTLTTDASLPAETVWMIGDACEIAARLLNEGRHYDLVLASYMTNEMTDSTRSKLADMMWALCDRVLLIIEPGTQTGARIIGQLREQLYMAGAKIAAPCPAIDVCPLVEGDWCHFTCRVPRTKLHKCLKNGDVPYEDEKYSYVACAKVPSTPAAARILRHPVVGSGRITLTLCTADGAEKKMVTKKDKTLFAAARKADCGDAF